MSSGLSNDRPAVGRRNDVTLVQVQTEEVEHQPTHTGTLRLRATGGQQTRVQWADNVVDNEGLGKKSSKGK